MIKKIFSILILLFFLNHCEYKPIYSDLGNKSDFELNIINIEGDNEMNNLVSSGIKKYSKKSSNKIYDISIETKYIRENLIKNKKGETTTYLLINEINFYVTNKEIDKNYKFSETIKTKSNNNQFEFKKYERSVKSNFINSKINELILKLSSLE